MHYQQVERKTLFFSLKIQFVIMEPTKAPWATKTSSTSTSTLPPVSRGETTTAPWARPGASSSFIPQRPLEVSISATPKFPSPIDDLDTHTFLPARKHITTIDLLQKFLHSSAAIEFLSFVLAVNASVTGLPLSQPAGNDVSKSVTAMVTVLDTLDTWINEIPPAAHALRYGNPSFRVWCAKLKTEAATLLSCVLPRSLRSRSDVLAELTPYFIDSFGNETRIDYGTGHETTFIAFLFCLSKIGGVFSERDCKALATRVFARYVRLMRRIQTTYWLEPAGSHGVWGLDDYQFFPFIFGSSQLVGHPYLLPSDINRMASLDDDEIKEWMYLAAVRFVQHVKKGPLAETSPMLHDIAAVPSWEKVNKGMIKMYQAEVLGKLPIMQHFLFGSLIPFPS